MLEKTALSCFNLNQSSSLIDQDSRNASDDEWAQESSIPRNLQSSEFDLDSHSNSSRNNNSCPRVFPAPCKHRKAQEYVCLTHKEKICSDCMAFEIHSAPRHKIKPLEFLDRGIDPEIRSMEDLILNIDIFSKNTEKIYEEKRKETLSLIKEKFAEFKFIVKAKEVQLLSEVNCFYDKEIEKMCFQTRENSLVKKVIVHKCFEYLQITRNEKPFELLEEDLSATFKIIEESTNPHKMNQIDKRLDDLKKNIDLILDLQLSALERLTMMTEDLILIRDQIDLRLDEKLSLREELAKYTLPFKNLSDLTAHSCLSQSSLTTFGSSVFISYPLIGNINPRIDRRENISVLEFKLSGSVKEVSPEDVSLLCFIRSKFPNIKDISINLMNYQVSDNALLKIFNCLFWKSNSLKSLSLKSMYPNKELLDKSILYLAENVLSTIRNLQKLSIHFEEIDLTTNACSSLNERISQLAENLIDFYFVCQCKNVEFAALQKLFVSMPNLHSFVYLIDTERFEKEVFEGFILNTLPSLKKLTDLQLSIQKFYYSDIEDQILKKLLNSFPQEWLLTLNQFDVNLGHTGVKDETLKEFVYETVAKFKALEKLKISICGDGVFPKIMEKISRWEKILCEKLD